MKNYFANPAGVYKFFLRKSYNRFQPVTGYGNPGKATVTGYPENPAAPAIGAHVPTYICDCQ